MSDSEIEETYVETETESESDNVNSDSDEKESEVENDGEEIESEDEEAGDENCDEDDSKGDIRNENENTHVTEKQDGNPSEFESAFDEALANEAAKAIGDMWNIIVTKQVDKLVESAINGANSNQSDKASHEIEKAEPASSKANGDNQPCGAETGASTKVVSKVAKVEEQSNNGKPVKKKNLSTTKSQVKTKREKALTLDDASKVTATKKTELPEENMNVVEDHETKAEKKATWSTTKNSSRTFDSMGREVCSDDDDGYCTKLSNDKGKDSSNKSHILQDDLTRLAQEYDGTLPAGIEKKVLANNNISPSSSKLTQPFVPSNKEFEDIIDTGVVLYFWNDMGGSFMGYAASAMPLMLKKIAGKNAKFCIVWVDSHASKVAIKSLNSERHERYISCGKKIPVTNSALACFSSSIGRKETFTIQKVNNSFLFQSYNHLFLHYNETYHSVAFKSCSERDKNGIPKKGRWSLLLENETNRVGTKDGLTQICYQMSVGWMGAAGRSAAVAAGSEAASAVF